MFFPVCILSRFGEKCEQICHCNVPGCDVVTGHCNIGKCAEGWAGESCNGTIHLCYWYDKYITDNETLNTLIIHVCLVISHLSRENYRRILEKKRKQILFFILVTKALFPNYFETNTPIFLCHFKPGSTRIVLSVLNYGS